tara:strand:+ start:250 stop:681 length:432 start_codon:yes stop_codon:yes gene_type:complete
MLKEMLNEIMEMQEMNENKTRRVLELKEEVTSLNEQLKTKFSNEQYVLVHVGDLTRLMNRVEDAEGDASNLESDICDLEYSEVGTISSHISDCSYTASSVAETCRSIFEMVEELLKVEQEAEEAGEPVKVSVKKAPAKKKGQH